MGRREFARLIRSLERLSPQQRGSLIRVLRKTSWNLNDVFGEHVHCPHCESSEFMKWGKVRGVQRWRCKECDRTFSTLTGTPVERLRRREVWNEFAQATIDGLPLELAAGRCGIHRNTAHRWRQRFLQGFIQLQPELNGIVEADETYLLRSAKGQPKVRQAMRRPARERGGKARKRGLSKEQVPILMVQDRLGHVLTTVSDPFNKHTVGEALAGKIPSDAILCTDGHPVYVSAARDLEVQHERIVHRTGKRKRGPFHVQNVNNTHSAFKQWMKRFNGVSTARLPLYVAWYTRIDRESGYLISPKHVLQGALLA